VVVATEVADMAAMITVGTTMGMTPTVEDTMEGTGLQGDAEGVDSEGRCVEPEGVVCRDIHLIRTSRCRLWG